MKSKYIKILLITMITVASCYRTKYQACFNLNQSIAQVNDTILISNCSDFDGGSTDCMWNFGDGTIKYTIGLSPISYSYQKAGIYEITLWIGGKENGSLLKKTITIQ